MEREEDPFVYSRAVVCAGVSSSLPAAALREEEPDQAVDLDKARREHDEYVEVLKQLVKEVHTIPVDERYPDCVFVEDPVVVCDGTAFLPILGHENRRGETVAMRKMMEKLGLKIIEMVEPGRMDGGDVLFTGREFFVGLSKRTNEDGLSQMMNAFCNYHVTGIPVEGSLHLKSFMTMAGPDVIAIGSSSHAKNSRKLIEEKARFSYRFYEIPDDTGANCLYLNNSLIHVSKKQSPASCEKFEQLVISGKKIALDGSELKKVDGCLTCSCVLIR